jgi:hypothetical protein
MTTIEEKAVLQRYLQRGRDALLFKLGGLSEYDARRPMTPTGTNLLGLVKHVASVEAGYLGEVFGRPFPDPMPWTGEDAEDNADMWATVEESIEDIVAFYRRVWLHSDATIEALALDAPGRVPWWGDRGDVTLHQVLVHTIAETDQHAGHADIVRELIDGTAGLRAANDNLPPGAGRDWWARYREMLEGVAAAAAAKDRRD